MSAADPETLPDASATDQQGSAPAAPEAAAAPPANVSKASDAVLAAEAAAIGLHKKVNTQAVPVRQYLESTVVPVLMNGMQELCRQRPHNPAEFLAFYLLKHNPQAASPAGTAAKATLEAGGAAAAGAP